MMKKTLFFLLFVLPSLIFGQTILYNASTPHTDGAPSGAPTTYGAWIRYDKTNKVLYQWTGAAWTAISGGGTGGIYGGSGTVPAGTTASMTGNLAFANAGASAGERFSVTVDDGSSTNYLELEAGAGILLQSSGDGIFLEGETGFTDIISPSTINASQDDYAALDGANVGRLTASTAVNITGISGGFAGRILVLLNIGANTITLKNNNGSSAEANQFDIGADYALEGDNGIILIYDGTSTNWRIAGNKLAGAGGIYSGNGTIYAGGANVTFTGSNPLRFHRAGASGTPIIQQLFSSGTTGYFQRYRINNDSMDLLYALGRFIWQSKGAGFGFSADDGHISLETQLGIVSIAGDSVRITDMPIRDSVPFLVGSDETSYLKRIEGTNSGDIVAWDATNERWAITGGGEFVTNNIGGTLRPAQLTAKTDNWNPTGFSTVRRQIIEVSGDASFRCITGLEAATRDGVEKVLSNTGTNCLVFAKQHTGSDAENRFDFSKDLVLLPKMEATLRYDSVGARWKLAATNESLTVFGNKVRAELSQNTGIVGSFQDFIFNNSGGTVAQVGATSSTIGMRRFNFTTSTAATAFPSITGRTQLVFINDNVSYLRLFAKLTTGSTLSTAAEDYDIRLGFKASVDTNIVEGAYISYQYEENSGGWTLKTHDGATLTTTNAGAAITTSTSYALELIYYPYGEVTCFINGTRYTTTSTLPADVAAVPFIILDKDNGTTARTFDLYALEFETVLASD